MSNNKYYLNILTQILEINNNKFEIKTLRKALEIFNKTKLFYTQHKISKQETNESLKLLKHTVKIKLLELNPNLSNKALNKICKCYENNYLSLPNDITVINNELVLYQEKNYATPYIENIYLLNSNSKKELKELKQTEIETQNPPLTNRIITTIDEILKWYIPSEKPLISLKDNKIEINNYIKVFSNYSLSNTNDSTNINIKLLILEDWNEFYFLEIKLTIFKDESIEYTWKKLDKNTWNLSESLEKTKQQHKTARKKVLTNKTK